MPEFPKPSNLLFKRIQSMLQASRGPANAPITIWIQQCWFWGNMSKSAEMLKWLQGSSKVDFPDFLQHLFEQPYPSQFNPIETRSPRIFFPEFINFWQSQEAWQFSDLPGSGLSRIESNLNSAPTSIFPPYRDGKRNHNFGYFGRNSVRF